jgi:hypothetical protein
MDEFGSRFQHSDDPDVCFIPLCFAPTNTYYTVFFLNRDLQVGGAVLASLD